MTKLMLKDVWKLEDPAAFKIHFARYNGKNEPLDVWARDQREWQQWQEYRPGRDDFNRPFVFSLIQFYHEPDIWLFGGVWQIVTRYTDRYDVVLTDQGSPFVGRLKLKLAYNDRSTRVRLENHYDAFEVQEIIREPYSGRGFPGFENINVSFEELETLVRNSRPDWMAALSSVKGVYMISDVQTGKRYIGSAYGTQGIWSRWTNYVSTGHGGNVELRKLVSDPTLAYCRQAFRFTLLEYRPAATTDEVVIGREAFWKNILLSREHGLNRN
ncbi:GIY-YIG nuclease family protein [Sinorhizobium fredii]|uniref:GIY-YIG nuclease family protein n=1 Tax=Rhizobium fredii TaxID=380 RepID=UPI0004B26C6A|nr:GIY-YIG nuclease family protein [Sinorhizobium fredii]